ncbi:N-acetylmuramic acid 6-phosphate etherase [Defluviimonas aquaemixtae]|uniref:N-acetylmuramic acid 6-phosphate etherase n=1 Tax=Albidovulum aquaemixtae TaxID=1542388 RepID=A0A2R8B5C4_9RHOB|nr:N-acetylmuramic acid 6-phosphate etherase [Defluviimonas aquaemixtae]SPH17816.1 N-acetylmuramic acid 6-phosphate etherase [Defluviimonas aquaemixtae]
MPQSVTEQLHTLANGLDALPAEEALRRMLDVQTEALASVKSALPTLAQASEIMVDAIRGGGRLVYAGAGSSALMANADGLELPATFGIDPVRILLLMAGGLPTDARMPGATEDDAAAGARDAARIEAGDAVIAVTASGQTPYPVAVARAARAKGASVIAVANNSGAPIFEIADVAICLPTPPEIVAGSTRMGAGTAQKAALNMMSTLMGIRLGQVHDGMMVGLVADNAKLRDRARGMVETIAGVDAARAADALAAAGGAVKGAVLIATGAMPEEAEEALSATGGNLRAALERIGTTGREGRKGKTNQGSE